MTGRPGMRRLVRTHPPDPGALRKALRLNAWKSDPALEEVPVPEPGTGEVLVQVGGAGACHSDLT